MFSILSMFSIIPIFSKLAPCSLFPGVQVLINEFWSPASSSYTKTEVRSDIDLH